MGYKLQDYRVNDITRALPGSATTVYSTAFDLERPASTTREFLAETELEVTIPDLPAAQVANTETIVFAVLTSDSSDLSSGATTVYARVALYTGTGSTVTGATHKVKLPTNVKRYVGISITKTGATDASSLTATLKLKF